MRLIGPRRQISPILGQKKAGGFGQALHREAVVAEDIGLAAGHGVFVGNADDFEVNGQAGLREYASDGFAESAIHHVFFDGDDRFTVAGGGEDGLGVERFHGWHADHAAAAVGGLLKMHGGEQRVNHGFAGGDERDVGAFVKDAGFAELKWFGRRQVVKRSFL